jgi:hypothetical protein
MVHLPAVSVQQPSLARRPLTVETVTRETTPAPPQPRGIVPHLPALIIFALATLVLTWPLAREMDDTLVTWGDPVFQSWTLAWDWHALTTDPLSIFNANIFYPWGNTLAWSDHLFGQALLVTPILALTENGILANNISILIAYFLSALAMYLLVYDLTGNRPAGIIAGLAYAFAPSRMAHIEHLHLLSMQWPPLMLLCLRRIMRPIRHQVFIRNILPLGMRQLESVTLFAPPTRTIVIRDDRSGWYVGLGACFLAQGLFGIYFFYFSIVMLIVAGAVYAVYALIDRDGSALKRLLGAAVACALAGAMLLPTLWPYWQVHTDLDIERTTGEVNFWSADGWDYLAVSPRTRAWNEIMADNHRDIEQDLFPGLLLLCLAGIGLTHRRAGRERWVLLAVAVGSFVLSFGLTLELLGISIPGPYRILYDVLPGFRAIRVPARLGLLMLVGLGALAGLGVDRIWRVLKDELPLFPRYPDRLAKQPVLLGVLATTLALGGLGVETATRMDLPELLPEMREPLRADYVYIRDNPAPSIELPMGEGPVASAWPNYWSMEHWNEVVNGYSGFVPPTYYPLRERMRAFPDADTLHLLQGMGVENIIVHDEMPLEERARVEAAISGFPELALALAGPDAVYTLAPNPWMWELARSIPDGERVDLPNARADPLAAGFLMAILQREGHAVTGNGELDYFTFPNGGQDVCYAILGQDDEPSFYGYLGVSQIAEAGGMVVYRRNGCG